MEKVERINKYLSESGVCSRRDVDGLIESGRVEVNGLPARIGMQIDTTRDVVTVDGQRVDPTNPYNNAISLEVLQQQEERTPWWVDHNRQKEERETAEKLNPKSRLLRKGKKGSATVKSAKTGKKSLSVGQRRVLKKNDEAASMNEGEMKQAVKKENRERKTFSDFFQGDKQGLMNVKTRRVEGVNPKATSLRKPAQGNKRGRRK